ncbi:SCP-2 sterol transfer family protein [Evansella caseinilytica]|uniref:SCP-2 sterol transfer family protein n=1 Tax=Evansella caseinilytica TaxID=1503961 RepID=A0A1H3GYU0_9BACI|nr:SCP2 sterol-binding domain-containing protein [Evansella caseinilytica]SDY08452.1 SCP-2 sterol transfer family protein [Evansella caseinilytica]
MINELFEQLTAKMNAEPAYLENLHVAYEFQLEGAEAGTYQLMISENKAVYSRETAQAPKVMLKMNSDDFVKLAAGKWNPTVAYMNGKLKIRGDLSQALKLQTLLKKIQ